MLPTELTPARAPQTRQAPVSAGDRARPWWGARVWIAYGADALVVAATFLPVLASAAWKAFVQPRPFWAFFYDPETFYFHDGLRLLQGRAPLDVTHPGTPVQALSALLALATGAVEATPEQLDLFRAVAYCLAWGLQICGAVLLLRTVLARAPVVLRIVVLGTYFLAAKSLEYETVWSPELLYFAVGALALAAVWKAAGRGFDGRSSVLAGGAVGLACAVKFLFLPWLPALGLAAVVVAGGRGLRRLRALAGIVVGAALAFVAATLPAAARYPDMVAWVGRLASRSGRYGDAPQALPDASTLFANLGALLAGAKGWYLWVLLAAIGAGLALRRSDDDKDRRRLGGLALFAITAIALGHTLVMRALSAHYLLPSAVAAVGLAAVAAHAEELRRSRAMRVAVLLLVAALLAKHLVGDARTHVARNRMAADGRVALAAAVARYTPAVRPPIVVYGYSTPIPSLALRYFATDPALLQRVETRYPGEGHLGPGDRLMLPTGARRWDVMVLAPRDRQRFLPARNARLVDRVNGWEVLVPSNAPVDGEGARR